MDLYDKKFLFSFVVNTLLYFGFQRIRWFSEQLQLNSNSQVLNHSFLAFAFDEGKPDEEKTFLKLLKFFRIFNFVESSIYPKMFIFDLF